MFKLALLTTLIVTPLQACPNGGVDDDTSSDTNEGLPDPNGPEHNGSCTPVLSPECTAISADAENFCDAMATLANSYGLTDQHAMILDQSCTLGRPRCDTCALLQNYCDQDSNAPCDGASGLCSCIGESFDVS